FITVQLSWTFGMKIINISYPALEKALINIRAFPARVLSRLPAIEPALPCQPLEPLLFLLY
ncbi:MAG TPA: hypothetical protein VHQ70_00835, partial [Syntrophomonadaceae bacterium]|nr:hypothetical protein [Syntrophomonadaceae bacterium]